MKQLFLCWAFFLAGVSSCRDSSDLSSQTIVSGPWISECLNATGPGASSRIAYTFHDDRTFLRTQSFYIDNSCGNPAGDISHRGFYALEVLTDVSIYNIDMIISDVKATPLTAEGASEWTRQSLCDTADWVVNSAKNILGSTDPQCLSFGTSRIEYRDLVEVSVDQRLTFAASLADALPRPKEFPPSEPNRIFARARF